MSIDRRVLKRRLWANTIDAAKFIVSTPIILIGVVTTTFSIMSLIEKYYNHTFCFFISDLVRSYRQIFHYPFHILERFVHITINDPYKDIIVLWVCLSAIYARAYVYLNERGGPYLDMGRSESKARTDYRRLNFSMVTFTDGLEWKPRRRFAFISRFMQRLFSAWVSTALALEKKLHPKILFELTLFAWVALFLPLLLIHVALFDDMIMAVTWRILVDGEPTEDAFWYENISYDDADTEDEFAVLVSLRTFFLVQLSVLLGAVVMSTAYG